LAATTAALAPAQALWLDAQRLQWPGQPADGRYRLVRGAAPVVGDTLAEGSAMSGLLHPAAPLAREAAARWRHVAPGALLIWPDAPTTPQDWRGWLQDGAQRVHLVRLDAQERVLAATRLQQAGLLDALFARAAEPLNFGVQVGAAASAGRLWAPTARKVEVCLYPGATAAPAQRFAAEWEPASGSWRWQQPGDLRGRLYSYLVELQVPGLGWVRQRADLDDAALNPAGWDRQPRPRPGLRLHRHGDLRAARARLLASAMPACPAWRGQVPRPSPSRQRGMRHLRALARSRHDRRAPAAGVRHRQRARAGCTTPHRARPRPTARRSRPR
jgi:pullulanase